MEFYHVFNRGVDKRKIFLDDKDYFRFLHDLFEFNDEGRTDNLFYFFNKNMDVGRRYIYRERRSRKLLVKVHAFCLMPNHYHFLLSPIIDNGIPWFMKKLDGGYAKYFNEKYRRKGALFEGKYKRILVKNDTHFLHLPHYIHFNPLDLTALQWREKGLKPAESKKAMVFLKSYRWSSFLDFIGEKNFPSVSQRDFLLEVFNKEDGYRRSAESWLKELPLTEIKKLSGYEN